MSDETKGALLIAGLLIVAAIVGWMVYDAYPTAHNAAEQLPTGGRRK